MSHEVRRLTPIRNLTVESINQLVREINAQFEIFGAALNALAGVGDPVKVKKVSTTQSAVLVSDLESETANPTDTAQMTDALRNDLIRLKGATNGIVDILKQEGLL